jgi:formamidopyrimidine-DNA glycosylase
MPELPEVEAAMDVLRRHALGRTIARICVLHPAFKRRLSVVRARSAVDARIGCSILPTDVYSTRIFG